MFGRRDRAERPTRWTAIFAAGAAALGIAGALVTTAAADAVGLLKVRLGGDAVETRMVVELDGATTAKVISDGAGREVAILLSSVRSIQPQQGAGRGVVRAWTVEKASGGALLRMDLVGDAKLKRRFLLPPADGVSHYRYVIDVAAAPGAVMTSAPATVAPRLRGAIQPG
jgi:N-acetylmuramoyl-L-alanine amidase